MSPETTDTSTGPDKVTTSVETVEADRVLIAVSIRDKTQGEIDSEQTQEIQSIERGVRSVTYELACHTRAQWAEMGLDQTQINQRVDAIKASWSEADFVQWVKANLL